MQMAPVVLGREITLRQAAMNFFAALARRLKTQAMPPEQIAHYKASILAAVRFCEDSFTGEFGRFGGQFTSHGPDHAARVLVAAQHLGNMLTPALSDREVFVLGLSAILHDVGMTAPLPPEIATSNDDAQRWKVRRERHGEATAELLRACKGVDLQAVARPDAHAYHTYLPLMCAAHCTSGFSSHVSQLGQLARTNGDSERYATLAGVLLLADELDISCVRARPDRDRYQEFRCPITMAHWWKHWLVSDLKIDGGVIKIVCFKDFAPEGATDLAEGAREFELWTKSKLDHQLALLRQFLDPNGTEPVWRFEVSLTHTGDVWWKDDLPAITSDVIEAAQNARLKIPGQRMHRVIDPEKLVQRLRHPDEIRGPSEFFRQAIADRITHFRGQGQHVTTAEARRLYVEEPRNMALIDHAIGQWLATTTSQKDQGVNLKLFVGEIGVGKTHFLSVFLHEIAVRHPAEYRRSIVVRAELTECNPQSLLDVQRRVARSLYEALDRDLGLLTAIRGIMQRDFAAGVPLPIPLLKEEITRWQEDHVDSFIRACGMLCQADSRIRMELGDRAPVALCIFLDNSDHLQPAITADLYRWCNNISGDAGALLWVFLRPESFRRLQVIHQRAAIGLRGPEPIVFGASLKDVIDKRLETLPARFKTNEVITLQLANAMKFSATDITKAVEYIAHLALRTTDAMLPQLTERPDDGGEPNLRAGLQALLGILGSHVMTDDEFATALLLQGTIREQGPDGRGRTAVERWPKVLEALILGRRVWNSSECGAVENLFDPPEVQEYGDYLLLLHCLQVLVAANSAVLLGSLCARMGSLGYVRGRVYEAVHYLASRRVVLEDGDPQADPFVTRTFPLVAVGPLGPSEAYRDNALVQTTPWGRYHVATLIHHAQYWKHVYYDIILPASLTRHLDPAAVQAQRADSLRNQLDRVLLYLSAIEESWFFGSSLPDLARHGLRPVMGNVRDAVIRQLT